MAVTSTNLGLDRVTRKRNTLVSLASLWRRAQMSLSAKSFLLVRRAMRTLAVFSPSFPRFDYLCFILLKLTSFSPCNKFTTRTPARYASCSCEFCRLTHKYVLHECMHYVYVRLRVFYDRLNRFAGRQFTRDIFEVAPPKCLHITHSAFGLLPVRKHKKYSWNQNKKQENSSTMPPMLNETMSLLGR